MIKKQSLKEDIIRFLAYNGGWVSKGDLLLMKWMYPDGRMYMSETVGRKLREAEEESRIAVRDDENSKSVLYRFLPPTYRTAYIPWSMRDDKTKLFKKVEGYE